MQSRPSRAARREKTHATQEGARMHKFPNDSSPSPEPRPRYARQPRAPAARSPASGPRTGRRRPSEVAEGPSTAGLCRPPRTAADRPADQRPPASLRPALSPAGVKPGEVETFHDQIGYWLWEPATGVITRPWPSRAPGRAGDRRGGGGRDGIRACRQAGLDRNGIASGAVSRTRVQDDPLPDQGHRSIPTAAGPTTRRPFWRSRAKRSRSSIATRPP